MFPVTCSFAVNPSPGADSTSLNEAGSVVKAPSTRFENNIAQASSHAKPDQS